MHAQHRARLAWRQLVLWMTVLRGGELPDELQALAKL